MGRKGERVPPGGAGDMHRQPANGRKRAFWRGGTRRGVCHGMVPPRTPAALRARSAQLRQIAEAHGAEAMMLLYGAIHLLEAEAALMEHGGDKPKPSAAYPP